MNAYQILVGAVLPYVAVAAFFAGMAYRFRVWLKTPQPGKMKLFLSRPETTTRGVLKEVVFFKGLYHGDRVLWAFSWIFHVTLALVFVGHIRVFTGLADAILMKFGMSTEGIDQMSATSGGVAGIVDSGFACCCR